MNTQAKVAANFNQVFAAKCVEIGLANWCMELLTDTRPVPHMCLVRHNLPEGTTTAQAFFASHIKGSFPNLAAVA